MGFSIRTLFNGVIASFNPLATQLNRPAAVTGRPRPKTWMAASVSSGAQRLGQPLRRFPIRLIKLLCSGQRLLRAAISASTKSSGVFT